MSLRAQLIGLFVALAVVPLLAVAAIDYSRSVDALEDVIASQTAVLTERAAAQLQDRYQGPASSLALLAENTATGQLLAAPGAVDSTASQYLERLWGVTQRHFLWISYRDSAGAIIKSFDDSRSRMPSPATYVATQAIRDERHRVIGRVEVGLAIDSILPRGLDAHFGPSGRSAVVDTASGQFFYSAGEHGSFPLFREIRVVAHDTGITRRIGFALNDSSFVGSMTPVVNSPFMVLSVGNVTETGVPLSRLRRANLLAVVSITVAVSVLFLVLLWRATHSLAQLTVAADAVGRGNLSPMLPPSRGDEVGRLTAAFAVMVTRVRDTLAEIEQKRRLAVVGEFSSQISHEIRNPLTSIKLNLQTLERAVASGTIPPELTAPVTISLREVQRLDRVVRGVLQLGRGKAARKTQFRLHDAVSSAVAATEPALERQRVRVIVDDRSNGHHVRGDRPLIESVIMNIVLNAAESMPSGGEVRISTDDGDGVNRVRIEDHGPGVPAPDRERIFAPFYTTKHDGSGLGLAIAQRTVEEHDGRLWVESRADGADGAVFVLELPTVSAEAGK